MENQTKAMIEIDGAILEGGGQILRTAVSLSAITKQPCWIFNIRKGRPKPGLARQHLLGVQALAELCDAKLEGDYLGSEEISFYPGDIKQRDLDIKIETAGSITLILQSLVLPSLFSPSQIKINFDGGATDTFFSPTIDYFRYVFLKNLEKIRAKAEIDILKRGYYPEGEAEVKAVIFPGKLKNFELIERGKLKNILAISGASETLRDKKVAERQLAGMREVLARLKLPIEERTEYYNTNCPGSQVCLAAEFENTIVGADSLGKLGKRAEDVGWEAALGLLKEEKSGACLDKHMADQILPYMALVGSKSGATVSEITKHCQTNMWVIEKFLNGKFEVNKFVSTTSAPEIKGNLITWLSN